jgi:NADPH2:quinone reductase
MQQFHAFRIHADRSDYRAAVEDLTLDDLTDGEVVIEVAYSAVNYKDALAGTGRGRILRKSPLVGGIDLAGRVRESADPRFSEGDPVLVTGCGLSEDRDGGYAQLARVPADFVIPLPTGLGLREAMVIGTAGFTAALAIQRMEDNRQDPAIGPIAVTGATGGVGSFAIDMLAGRGYSVTAISGKAEAAEYLRTLGAEEIVDRRELELGTRPLERTRWGGAVDNVGGELLGWLTRTVSPWGSIASIGLAGGTELNTTVMPFILRGVSLLGINSVDCPLPLRHHLWSRIAGDLRPRHLDQIASETVDLEGLPDVFERMLAGDTRGRVVVRIGAED